MIATVLRHTLQLEHLSTQVLPMQSNDELMSYLKVFQKMLLQQKVWLHISKNLV